MKTFFCVDDFINNYDQRILYEWKLKELLHHYSIWLLNNKLALTEIIENKIKKDTDE